MRIRAFLLALTAGCVLGHAADWLTDAYDTKRTNWQRDEKLLSPQTAKDIKLLWKIKLDNQPREMHNLFPPLIVEKVNTSKGVKQMLVETGVSDNLYGIDVADGEELTPPAKFMPPNGKPYALNLFNNVLYTHTAQGCGGNPNMVYAYDLPTKKVGT